MNPAVEDTIKRPEVSKPYIFGTPKQLAQAFLKACPIAQALTPAEERLIKRLKRTPGKALWLMCAADVAGLGDTANGLRVIRRLAKKQRISLHHTNEPIGRRRFIILKP